MREIKFRCKRLDNGEWIYGFYNRTYTYEQGYKDCIFNHYTGFINVMPETVGQFTGLYDKNGKEIYEGDVVERFKAIPHYRNGEYYDGNAIYGVVRYIESGFYIVTKDNEAFKLCYDCDLYVKGNIFDNSDLLNNKSE